MMSHPGEVTPLRIAARPSSGVFERHRAALLERDEQPPTADAIATPFVPNSAFDLTYHGGKTIPQMKAQLIFVNTPTSVWSAGDRDNVQSHLSSAFGDVNLESVIAQYFDVPISGTVLPPKTFAGSLSTYGDNDVTQFIKDRFNDGTIAGDFANTCYCLMLAPGVRLNGSNGDSFNGLGGYHGSVDVSAKGGTVRVYFAVGVYSQFIPTPGGPPGSTTENGIVVLPNPWQNVCATFYHELNEFRTDPDVANGTLGWYADKYGEIGDIPEIEAGSNFASIVLDVNLANGSGTVPVQLMYSNKDHGPSAGDEIAWALNHDWQTAPNGGWAGKWPLGGFAVQMTVGANVDGRLEVFYVGTNGLLYHNWQVAPNGTWHGEVPLGGAALQAAVARNADGRLELFYVGTNNVIYHNWQTAPNGGWFGERPLGGSAKQLTVARNSTGCLEVFYVGTNDALYHNWQVAAGGNWAGETRFAQDSAKQIAVGQNADGRLEIFYVGTNNDLYHNWQTLPGAGPWAGETRFSGDSARQIAVSRNADGRLEIFYVGTNNGLYHNWQTSAGGPWFGETRFANNSAEQIAVASNADGRLEIFYVGTDTNIYHNWQTAPNGNWAGETRQDDQAKQVTLGQNADGRLELFYIGA